MAPSGRYEEYTGANFLRQRLVLAILSARPVRITRIRAREQDPGLRDCEAALLRLLDKVSMRLFISYSWGFLTLVIDGWERCQKYF
jgi:RNA 3'-terminal phosphate cyclase